MDGARDGKGESVAPGGRARACAWWSIGFVTLAMLGCPQWLPDEFEVVGAPDASGGAAGAAGSNTAGSGTGGGAAGDGEAGDGGSPVGGTGGDGGSGGSSGAGGGSAGQGGSDGSCSFGPFGEPEPVTGLGLPSGQSAWGPALSADGLTLLFSSGTPEDLFISTRSARSAAFLEASPLPGEVNTDAAEGTAFISFDGSKVYFYSRDSEGDDRDILVATRSGPTSAFGPSTPVRGVNSGSSDHLPWVSKDELRMYFTSSRGGGEGGYDLWIATRSDPNDDFGAARALAELNTPDDDEGTSLSEDELTLFFASERAGSSDIWMASRASVEDPFSTPIPASELNSDGSDLNPALSADGRELFFSTDRVGNGHELWRAARSCD